ncbi:hypothetical protein [uncultured Bacteroides sp.]|jgi:hypothetical protein|nr:hypothetical protein [uncultured Bacteroides sp.]
MKTTVLSTLLALSFAVSALTCATLGIVFWTSFITFAGTCIYIDRHKKELEAEMRSKGK